METDLESQGMKLPYEPGAYQCYGTVSGITATNKSPSSDGVHTSDGSEPAGNADPLLDQHDGDAGVASDGGIDGGAGGAADGVDHFGPQ